MIINRTTYRILDANDQDEALRRMTASESIAIGEAILTSELMIRAEFPDDDHPQSLAIGLGIPSSHARNRQDGSERV
jgi:hypothetical protein